MIIKKIISTVLCILTISSSIAFPISAARSANLSNTQIVNKVEQFNNSKLEKLDYYIWKINTKNFITGDLIDLYQKLDNLVVSNISVANELNETANSGNCNSIGSQLENIFSFIDIISQKYYTNQFKKSDLSDSQCYLAANLNTKIRNLFDRIDQVNNL